MGNQDVDVEGQLVVSNRHEFKQAILDAVEQGTVSVGEVPVANRQSLARDVNAAVRDRARRDRVPATGRRRQVNWMNMQLLERAIRINGITDVVFNKVDVLREVGEWAVRE